MGWRLSTSADPSVPCNPIAYERSLVRAVKTYGPAELPGAEARRRLVRCRRELTANGMQQPSRTREE